MKNIRRNFDRIAKHFEANDFLFKEINQRQISRLEFIKIEPKQILECGCGTGVGTQLLFERFKKCAITSIDLSHAMVFQAKLKKKWLQKNFFIQADAHTLPFSANSFDIVYSNLMLHWAYDFNSIFSEWQRVLKPNGLLFFTTFGPDTLQELRLAVQGLSSEQSMPQFVDMHNLGDALIKNKLVDPVMDVENIKLEYSSVQAFLQELRALGGRNINPSRQKHFATKSYLNSLTKQLEQYKLPNGNLSISFEIIYGHAWGSGLSQQTLQDAVIQVPLRSMKIGKSKQ